MDPYEEYKVGCTNYVAKMLDKPKDEARLMVEEALKNSDINNPVVTHYERDDNFDKFEKKSSLLGYLKTSKENKEVIAPSYTTYLNPNKVESFQKKFIEKNLIKRKEAKKKMAKAKAQGDTNNFIYYNVLQKILKIFNNSLSGAYAITSTVLHNPTAHYTLTSMTRSIASIGNGITEMLVSGNRYYKDYKTTLNALIMTVEYINLSEVQKVINKFKLHIPNVDEVMEVILRSSRLYWNSAKKESKIRKYLTKLNGIELAAISYVNDFYHLRKFNDKFARLLLGTLAKKCSGDYYDNDYSILDEVDDFILNTAYHICTEEFAGKDVNFEEMQNTDAIDVLVSTVKNISKTLKASDILMRTFFATDLMPVNMAEIKDMLRRSIILSDTDSTCGSYGEYIRWYYGRDIISPEATALSASIMMINGEAITHYLKVFSANMNVDVDVRDILSMKNEFYWPVMVPANVSKHYYAGVKIQEGRVNEELELETKGVHLHANKIPAELKKESQILLRKVQSTFVEGKPQDVYGIIRAIADKELELISRLENGDPYPLLKSSVKNHADYAKDEEESKFRHFTLWQTGFSCKYKDMHEPRYVAYDVPVILDKTKGMRAFIASESGDKETRESIIKAVNKLFKGGTKTLCLPQDKLDEYGIPTEILDILDKKRAVELAMKPFYIILETIGFYKNPKLLVHEMIE
jgi:hypothetical protein